MKPLQPNEQRLEGQWIKSGGNVVEDATAQRIQELVMSGLTKLADSESGWESLYLDKSDSRMWELTYPRQEWHGGGPPTLTHVSADYVKSKYKIGQ
jgi:hypothetical protein